MATLTLWHITSWTQRNIPNVPLKKLLSHTATKDELVVFMSKELLEFSKEKNTLYTAACHNKAEASHRDVNHLSSSQEEADTKLILHAVDACKNGATELTFFSLDTDLFVLCLRRYTEFSSEIIFMI